MSKKLSIPVISILLSMRVGAQTGVNTVNSRGIFFNYNSSSDTITVVVQVNRIQLFQYTYIMYEISIN